MDGDDNDVPEWLLPVMIVAALTLFAATIVFAQL